jgi:hypothetical protein
MGFSATPRGVSAECAKQGVEYVRQVIHFDTVMTKVEALEREVEALTPEELAAFRDWFVEHDWQSWDRQIERDAAGGRLDRFEAEALAEFERGETREI